MALMMSKEKPPSLSARKPPMKERGAETMITMGWPSELKSEARIM